MNDYNQHSQYDPYNHDDNSLLPPTPEELQQGSFARFSDALRHTVLTLADLYRTGRFDAPLCAFASTHLGIVAGVSGVDIDESLTVLFFQGTEADTARQIAALQNFAVAAEPALAGIEPPIPAKKRRRRGGRRGRGRKPDTAIEEGLTGV